MTKSQPAIQQVTFLAHPVQLGNDHQILSMSLHLLLLHEQDAQQFLLVTCCSILHCFRDTMVP